MNGNENRVRSAEKRRKTAVFLAVLFVIIVALSLGFIAENHDHECSGADCSVCAVLRVAEEISGGAKKAASAALLFSFVFAAVLLLRKVSARFVTAVTPISLKDILTI